MLLFSLLGLSLGHRAVGQAVLVDDQCENATVDGRPGFVDFDENGVLAVWDNDTEVFLAAINPAQYPPSQQVLAGGAPTPQPNPTAQPPPTTQPTPMPQPPGQQAGDLANEFLTTHNTHRAKKNLRPLTWSAELAGIAQEWADNHARSNCGELPPHRPTSFFTTPQPG